MYEILNLEQEKILFITIRAFRIHISYDFHQNSQLPRGTDIYLFGAVSRIIECLEILKRTSSNPAVSFVRAISLPEAKLPPQLFVPEGKETKKRKKKQTPLPS